MIVSEILANPTSARRYMERYVNDGSPSGFTRKFTSSPQTSPFGSTQSFRLAIATVPLSLVQDLGELPGWLQSNEIPLHPDMVGESVITSSCRGVGDGSLLVAPTASARTVELLDSEYSGFVKLNYKGLLGRVDRQISSLHALTAIDVTSILDRATREHILPKVFSCLRESGARVASLEAPDGTSYEWGAVFREVEPHPPCTRTAFLIPAFSLFSRDVNRCDDPPLLMQLVLLQELSTEEYLFENIIEPIVSCYFELLLTCALQFECNAQNILLGFDEHGKITTVLFRDFESVDKDVSLADELALDVTFHSKGFKCVHRGLYNYSIKHSFMYDFKLGEYLLAPVIATVPDEADRSRLRERTKNLGRAYVDRLPQAFFPPDGKWYSYDNVVVDKTSRRPYIGNLNPKYR